MSTKSSRSVVARMIGSLLVAAVFLVGGGPSLAQKKHPAEDKTRSLKSDVATSIEFDNKSLDVVKVFWLNLEGKRELVATLKPGERATQKTFLNHAFVLTDEKDNALGLYYPDADKRVVTYGQVVAPPMFGKGGGGGGLLPPGGFPFPGGKGKGGLGGGFALPAVPVSKLAYVQDAAALEELKLDAEQTAQVKALDAKHKNDVDGLAGMATAARSRKIIELQQELDRNIANLLKPAQNRRLEQMQMQDLGAGLFTDKTLLDALQLTPEQQGKLPAVASQFNGQRLAAIKADPDAGAEFVKKLGDARKTAFDAATAMLTAEQKTIWNELVGAPWHGYAKGTAVANDPSISGSALRTRDYAFNNWTTSNPRFLQEKSVQAALKLTDEQLKKVAQMPAGLAPTALQKWNVSDLLTAEQEKQYRGIYMQQSMTAYGPAGPFRYIEVQNLLALSEEQKTKILAIGQSDANAMANLAPRNAETIKKLNKTTEAKIDEVLTADQRGKLKAFIGEQFTGVINTPFGNPSLSFSTFEGKGGGKKGGGIPP
jgi:hypothetical protein